MKRIRVLLLVLLGVGAASLLFLLGTSLFMSWHGASAADLERQKHQLRGEKARLQQENELAQQWRRVGQAFADFKTQYTIPAADFSAFRNELETIFNANGLRPTQFGYSTHRLTAGLVRMAIHFNVKGEYAQVKRLLYRLETHPRLVIISKLTLSAAGEMTSASTALEVYLAE